MKISSLALLTTSSLKSCPANKIQMLEGAGKVAQVVQHLPSKCEALSSNPSAAKEKNQDKYQDVISCPAPVAYTCNPSYSRQRSGRWQFEASPSKQFRKPYLKNTQHEKDW
jgi:hypothetical protein